MQSALLALLQQHTQSVPNIDEIVEMQSEVALLMTEFRYFSMAFGSIAYPDPYTLADLPTTEMQEQLVKLVISLRTTKYPIELVRVMNDARLIASQTAREYELFLRTATELEQYHNSYMLCGKLISILANLNLLNDILSEYISERQAEQNELAKTKDTRAPKSLVLCCSSGLWHSVA